MVHVIVEPHYITLVVHTQIERSAGGGVEKGADAFHHVHVLGILIGLHIVIGGKDNRGLELERAAFHTKIDALVGFKVGIVLCLHREGTDNLTTDHVEGRTGKGALHGVSGLDESGESCQLRQ